MDELEQAHQDYEKRKDNLLWKLKYIEKFTMLTNLDYILDTIKETIEFIQEKEI